MTLNSEKIIPAGIRFSPSILEALDHYAQEFCNRNRSQAVNMVLERLSGFSK